MTTFWRIFFILPVLAGCSAQSGPVDAAADAPAPVLPRAICDGSDEPRVFVGVQQVGSGRFFSGHRVLFDNGSFIVINGHCRFWVKPGENIFEEVRTGVLDSATLAEFVDDLRYDRWPALGWPATDGVYFSDGGVYDAPDIVFVDREVSVRCSSLCLGDSTPADVVAMREAQTVWNARLWAAGAAVTGDMRISVIESGLYPADWSTAWRPIAWPASIAIDDLAVSIEAAEAWGYGDGVLLTGPDVDALRTLRREFLRGDHGDIPSVGNSALISDSEGPLYYVNVRDTTPFEDARGLISWPLR